YGPIFRCSLFGRAQTIVSVDPEFNKYVLQNEGRLFQAKYPSSTVKIIGKYGLLDVHGELQRKLHGTAVNLLEYEKLSSDFMDDIQHVFLDGMKKWEQQRDIPLQHKCHQLVLNLMGKKLLDLPPAEEMEEIYKAFDQYVGASLCLPLNIPGTAFARGIKARKTLIKKIYKCMEERRQHPEVAHNDLLSKLLKEGTFSDEIIADLILFLLFAGFETSSTTMAFAVKFLTEHPRVLEDLREEHDVILKAKGKDNQKLTWDDYKSMKLTQCVIKETLRLVSAAPVFNISSNMIVHHIVSPHPPSSDKLGCDIDIVGSGSCLPPPVHNSALGIDSGHDMCGYGSGGTTAGCSGSASGKEDSVGVNILLNHTTHEIYNERSVKFNESSSSTSLPYELLLLFDFDSNSLDDAIVECVPPPLDLPDPPTPSDPHDLDYSNSNSSNDEDFVPYHSSEESIDYDLDPPSPCLTRKTLQSAREWFGDPSDERFTHLECVGPHSFFTYVFGPHFF
ncbi:hypothetical protein KI387_016157, partial [Taxus chinensis]